MFEELRVNELFDLKEKGYFAAGSVDTSKFVLSAFGQAQFERLVESLPAKDQVLVRMMAAQNAEKSETELKAFMQ